MFTKEIDPHAYRWSREGQPSATSVHPRMEPLVNLRDSGRGLGIPPPEKFRSGHLPPGSISMSHAIPTGEDSQSGSDMDETSDTEAEIYEIRHSFDSSSVDEVAGRRVPNGTFRPPAFRNRHTGPGSTQNYYSSDGYSDVSSSVDTTRKQPHQIRKMTQSEYMIEVDEEDGLSDSGQSLEFSSQVKRRNDGCTVPLRGGYASENYSRNVPQRSNANENAAKGGVHSKFSFTLNVPYMEGVSAPSDKLDPAPQTVYHSNGYSQHIPFVEDPAEKGGLSDYPSAPPIHGYDKNIADDASEQIAGVRSPATSNGSILMKDSMFHANSRTNQSETTTSLPQRSCQNTEAARSSSLLPARLPTFHASAQGPWFSVIAYDACVRLCLHSWARGCMEAPIFLDNECALLRDAFCVRQVLLQSEEELLAKRSSELVCEGAGPKPKKIIGKMKVQVRKVRMALDMPSGCSFSSFRQPIVKLESLRFRMSSLQATLSSGWESLRKVRVMPNLPANSSFSRHSLAYMHASSQYIKQVSGLLKIGVSTLRSSNSSYEVMEETYSCQLKLKSSPEDDCVKMQPGSGDTHVFFPDSLGDDLIIDIYDSKGKSCGRVVAQVACIADDPSDKLRWWPIYHEPEHELVGRVQLYINYTTSPDENNGLKLWLSGLDALFCIKNDIPYVAPVICSIEHWNFKRLWCLSEAFDKLKGECRSTPTFWLREKVGKESEENQRKAKRGKEINSFYCLPILCSVITPASSLSPMLGHMILDVMTGRTSSTCINEHCTHCIGMHMVNFAVVLMWESMKTNSAVWTGVKELTQQALMMSRMQSTKELTWLTLRSSRICLNIIQLLKSALLKGLFPSVTNCEDATCILQCGSVAETVAYDVVLEVAMKAQHFQQRRLLLHGSWKWLLTEFSSYYGVSDSYTKLRYLSYVMDVATPTADCLTLVHDLLLPVILKSRNKNSLSHQENRILGEIEDQIEQILAIVFENYKSLDESLTSGMSEVFRHATGYPAPALIPAMKLFTLLHDILTPEAQLKLCGYFQTAAKKRSRRHLLETDEYLANNSETNRMDVVGFANAYQKMRTLCFNIQSEIFTDIEIHKQHVLPRAPWIAGLDAHVFPTSFRVGNFLDLPNLSASIYNVELSSRLRSFLVACPPSGPSQPVADLVIATADFQKNLTSWNICPVKGGVDAKELFHLYIILWIQDKRLALLESCKLDKVKWSGVRTQHMTTPFVDDMYDRLKDTLIEYDVIICRWPEYTFVLENVDIEKAVIEALEKQYAVVLAPLKDSLTPKKFGLKYVQKFAKRNSGLPYAVPDDLGILLNTMKRLLEVLQPKIEMQLKSWGSCIPDGGNAVPGEQLSEVTVTLRAKFRNFLQAVVEKLVENTRVQSTTKLKKIIQDSKDAAMESDIRSRMQPLRDLLIQTINELHKVLEVQVFVAVCRGFWDRMGQDALKFLENRKENRPLYKGARVTIAVLGDTFASQMQQLLGNVLQEKDLEPPRSILEVRSVLCKDAALHKDSSFYY
ncbi:hypothetical protein ZIOFF_072841 [Zingiber officinale]|uniref:Uncharacterized protein n=1 Tax=Zingiber officinale TaxID=94328 RepID=A0A8J5EM24_ZINOF|nr:hypothetical protein ZIOFF_072841 [Zingiber officinale]